MVQDGGKQILMQIDACVQNTHIFMYMYPFINFSVKFKKLHCAQMARNAILHRKNIGVRLKRPEFLFWFQIVLTRILWRCH